MSRRVFEKRIEKVTPITTTNVFLTSTLGDFINNTRVSVKYQYEDEEEEFDLSYFLGTLGTGDAGLGVLGYNINSQGTLGIQEFHYEGIHTEIYNDIFQTPVHIWYDLTGEGLQEITINVPTTINGIVRVEFDDTPKYLKVGEYFNTNLLGVKFIDGFNKEIPIVNANDYDSGSENYVRCHLYDNDTSVEYQTFNFIVSYGNGIVNFQLISEDSFWFHSSSEYYDNDNIFTYVYSNVPSALVVNNLKPSYFIGQDFDLSKITCIAKYPVVDNVEYYEKQVYDFTANFSGKFTINDMPTKTIMITYGSLNKLITINVSGQPSDNVYYFDKIAPYTKHLYGELQQNNFNMSLVLDGTKDSTKIVILNFVETPLKPNTIVYLESTDSWWVVAKDKVNRYEYENGVGRFKHEIQLLGAIEILNARDLTNCGFNRDRYTIDTFLKRLMALTDFEFNVVFDYGNIIDKNQIVTYLKTFDNYTPLSAIREFCDGLNCSAKMYFTELDNHIDKAIIYFVSKESNGIEMSIDEFSDNRAIETYNKNNYGSKVISNVENCVSQDAMNYPIEGCAKLDSNSAKVDRENGIIRLPSPAFKVNSITLSGKFYVNVMEQYGENVYELFEYSIYDYGCIDKVINYIKSKLSQEVLQDFNANIENVKANIFEKATITLKNGGEYNWNATSDEDKWLGDYVLAYDANWYVIGHHENWNEFTPLLFNDETHAQVQPQTWRTITWKQGSDIISNFTILNVFTTSITDGLQFKGRLSKYAIQQDFNNLLQNAVYKYGTLDSHWAYVFITGPFLSVGSMGVNVNYEPMHDLKIKVDNEKYENDSEMYNQNGKLVDGNPVSKLINSYAQAISSSELTRYRTYYNYFDIPKVGTIVKRGNDNYVINNVSINFTENDNNHYKMDCEFTMTKQVACKSTMISANTNIRDYQCPQQNNIIRTQVYRDYIELDYQYDTNSDIGTYMPLSYLFSFEFKNKGNTYTHTAFVRSKDSDFKDSSYCYKLYASKYYLEKMFVEVIDFKDNNIVGYAHCQRNRPFQFSSWWEWVDNINIPISYVDNYGEVDNLELLLMSNEQVGNTYSEYAEQEDIDITTLSDIKVVISEDMYNIAKDNDYFDMIISEPNYKKDGLEVPVFQYMAQVGDANDIIFGSDFLKAETCGEKEFFEYSFFITDKQITKNNWSLFDNTNIALSGENYTISNSVKIDFSESEYTPEHIDRFTQAVSGRTGSVQDASGHYIAIGQLHFSLGANQSIENVLITKGRITSVDTILGVINYELYSNSPRTSTFGVVTYQIRTLGTQREDNICKVHFYANKNAKLLNGEINTSSDYSSDIKGVNIGIVVHKCNYSVSGLLTKKSDLLFAINNCRNEKDENNDLNLIVNNWKLR